LGPAAYGGAAAPGFSGSVAIDFVFCGEESFDDGPPAHTGRARLPSLQPSGRRWNRLQMPRRWRVQDARGRTTLRMGSGWACSGSMVYWRMEIQMSSPRSALLVLACALPTLLCSVACSGDAQSNGSAGAGPISATGGNSEAGAGAGAGAGGAAAHVGGMSGAAVGGYVAAGAPGTAGAPGAGSAGLPTAGAFGSAGAPSGGAPSSGGASGYGGGGAAAGGASGCSGLSQTRSARTGKSAGFSGGYQSDYYPLYSHACSVAADCAAACVTAGGTQTSCAASECVDSSPDYCLPPTYWFDFDKLLTQSSNQDPVETQQESSVWLIMVNNPYRDQLLASNFQFEIPSGAKILGISFAIREAAGSENMISDFSVRALSNNATVGLDRGHTTAWSTTFHPEIYGGAADLWGTTWTADSVNATGFGIALTPMYLDSAGNDRAYVDFISATVTYDVCK